MSKNNNIYKPANYQPANCNKDFKYLHSHIYKITSSNTELFYVGSTCQLLAKRLLGHIKDFYLFKSGYIKHCCSSRKVLEFGSYSISSLESFRCTNKLDLLRRERFWIEKLQSPNCVNINKPTGIKTTNSTLYFRQYRKLTPEQQKKIKQKYVAKNKLIISEKQKKYYQKNKVNILATAKNRRTLELLPFYGVNFDQIQ